MNMNATVERALRRPAIGTGSWREPQRKPRAQCVAQRRTPSGYGNHLLRQWRVRRDKSRAPGGSSPDLKQNNSSIFDIEPAGSKLVMGWASPSSFGRPRSREDARRRLDRAVTFWPRPPASSLRGQNPDDGASREATVQGRRTPPPSARTDDRRLDGSMCACCWNCGVAVCSDRAASE